MKSIRIETIASLVDKDAYVLDIGTDHAYLPIYLYKHNITKNILASDISEKVLESSLKNLKTCGLDKEIKLVLSDGFKNISSDIDTTVISGMGTNNIINIISNATILPKIFILSPHNNYYELRSFMKSIGYKIDKEIAIKDNDIFYVILKYIKGNDKLTEEKLLFGLSNNKEYFQYLFDHYNKLYNLSNNSIYGKYTKILKKLLKKS